MAKNYFLVVDQEFITRQQTDFMVSALGGGLVVISSFYLNYFINPNELLKTSGPFKQIWPIKSSPGHFLKTPFNSFSNFTMAIKIISMPASLNDLLARASTPSVKTIVPAMFGI